MDKPNLDDLSKEQKQSYALYFNAISSSAKYEDNLIGSMSVSFLKGQFSAIATLPGSLLRETKMNFKIVPVGDLPQKILKFSPDFSDFPKGCHVDVRRSEEDIALLKGFHGDVSDKTLSSRWSALLAHELTKICVKTFSNEEMNDLMDIDSTVRYTL